MDDSMMDGPMMDREGGGMMASDASMPDWMMSGEMGGGMGSGMMEDMQSIHTLLVNHESIEREVTDVPDGVVTVTRSDDPEITAAIRRHVHQMKERVEEGQPIRMMDPVFRELFENHGKLRMEIEEIPGGVRVRETSDDPQIVLLIRQHAHRAVSEFVDEGMSRAMRSTPLPEGYAE
ncbi:MAG: hypothetical protein KY459_02990 [Acidobacteria bacterium]|nr:hypothetical protein [Acidobacteriota bacterium]